jgi:thiamine biosynthesis protein ThiS
VATIDITVNGQSRQIAAGATVADLIAELGFAGKPIAVERNRAVIPKKTHAETALEDGDHLELVTFVGGG